MISSRTWAAVLCLSPAALLALGGCVSSQPAVNELLVAREPASLDEPFPPGEVLVAPGTADLENIHLPSVMVNASILTEKGLMSRKFCSGVILHQKMVVSAAHCVCAPRSLSEADKFPRGAGAGAPGTARSERAGKQGMTRVSALRNVSVTSIVDASSLCAKTATVATVQYIATESGTASNPETRDYTGEVVIHPAFEIITGQRGQSRGVVWSNADLAVIFLKEPLPAAMPRLELTDAEVQAGDAITMVGYSYGADESPVYGTRHFGANRVSRLIHLETGSSLFRSEEKTLPDGTAASHMQGGDSGGACVRSSNKNALVGISTVGSKTSNGEYLSIFTSVYSHRGWLLQMLERAEKS
jgi:hypothetical protein